MSLKKTTQKTTMSAKESINQLLHKLHEAGLDPVTELANIALDANNATALRAKILVELLPYVAPKRKSVDINLNEESEGAKVTIIKYSKNAVASAEQMMDEDQLKRERNREEHEALKNHPDHELAVVNGKR